MIGLVPHVNYSNQFSTGNTAVKRINKHRLGRISLNGVRLSMGTLPMYFTGRKITKRDGYEGGKVSHPAIAARQNSLLASIPHSVDILPRSS